MVSSEPTRLTETRVDFGLAIWTPIRVALSWSARQDVLLSGRVPVSLSRWMSLQYTDLGQLQ